jgi:hypothetical protein
MGLLLAVVMLIWRMQDVSKQYENRSRVTKTPNPITMAFNVPVWATAQDNQHPSVLYTQARRM